MLRAVKPFHWDRHRHDGSRSFSDRFDSRHDLLFHSIPFSCVFASSRNLRMQEGRLAMLVEMCMQCNATRSTLFHATNRDVEKRAGDAKNY